MWLSFFCSAVRSCCGFAAAEDDDSGGGVGPEPEEDLGEAVVVFRREAERDFPFVGILENEAREKPDRVT